MRTCFIVEFTMKLLKIIIYPNYEFDGKAQIGSQVIYIYFFYGEIIIINNCQIN